jgi:hypothetical protein
MSYFLLKYKTGEHEDPVLERFEDAELAMQKFIEAERWHRDHDKDHGVVLLVADSVETLRRTHTHYFLSLDEMLAEVGVNGPSRG